MTVRPCLKLFFTSFIQICLQFHNADDAKRAMEQLNGFELAGRAMKVCEKCILNFHLALQQGESFQVGHVTEHTPSGPQGRLDSDEMDRAGIDLGTTGRLQLMAKLAEGEIIGSQMKNDWLM